MSKNHPPINNIRSLATPPPNHLQARILDALHQEQTKTVHRRQDVGMLIWFAATISFIASATVLSINLSQNDFGSIMQTIFLNYHDISIKDLGLALLENLPFGSLALTFITATWFTLALPRKPFATLRHNLIFHL